MSCFVRVAGVSANVAGAKLLVENMFDGDKGKGKALPRTGHEDPEGQQMYSSTLPSTSVLDGGGWSVPRPGCFAPGKEPVPIV